MAFKDKTWVSKEMIECSSTSGWEEDAWRKREDLQETYTLLLLSLLKTT